MSRKPPEDEIGSSQKTGHGSQYSSKKDAAIEALLTQRNVEEAAGAAEIGKQTLVRWVKIPEFQADYREARRTAVFQSRARLQQASSAGAFTLLNGRWTETQLDGLVRPVLTLTGYGTPCGSGTVVSQAATTYGPCGCSPLGKMMS